VLQTFYRQKLPTPFKMPVPNVRSAANAAVTQDAQESDSTPHEYNSGELASKSPRKFGKATALLSPAIGKPRTSTAKNDHSKGLQDRQSCVNGTQFYRCSNGFIGCCSVNPCDPDGGCPDIPTSSTHSPTAHSSTSVLATTSLESQNDATTTTSLPTPATTTSHASTSTGGTTTMSSKGGNASRVASVTSRGGDTSTVSATSSTVSAAPAPACPAGNGTVFTDSSNVSYLIHCNADNTYPSQTTVQVDAEGYQGCFNACSVSTSCAGFTFVGLDSGSCYLKAQMPSTDFAAKDGTNYISCAKVNATAVAPLPSTSSSPGSSQGPIKKSGTAAVVGGVIGGIALLVAVLVLIALIAKHRRKKIEERRATVTHVSQGPLEIQPMTGIAPNDTRGIGGGHHHVRSGSTAHDAFAPFGGSYYPPTHTRQRSIYQDRGEQQWV